MKVNEINDAILMLQEQSRMLEEAYIENGGEVTEETESAEQTIELIKSLLMGEGVDSLGRWLKSKEDQKAALKDEKAKIDRMMKATENTIAYAKVLIDKVLESCGVDQAKGLLYSFKRTNSVTHTANTELIEERYSEKVEKVAKDAGLPVWLKVKISPSYSLVPEGVKTDEFITTTSNTITFRKPSKAKE